MAQGPFAIPPFDQQKLIFLFPKGCERAKHNRSEQQPVRFNQTVAVSTPNSLYDTYRTARKKPHPRGQFSELSFS